MKAIPTVADLRHVDPHESAAVLVLGYHSVGDGGGGLLAWRGDERGGVDQGLRFAFDGRPGVWARLDRGPLDVRWFGARGDGVTDDTRPLRRAVQAAAASVDAQLGRSRGSTPSAKVLIPPGAFLFSSETSEPGLAIPQGVSLVGEGPSSQLLYEGPATAIHWTPTQWMGMHSRLEDFRLLTVRPEALCGIRASGVWCGTIRNVTFSGGDHHVGKSPTFGFRHAALLVENGGAEGQINPLGINVADCSFHNVAGDAVRIGGFQVVALQIRNCVAQNISGWAINSTIPYAHGSWASAIIDSCDLEGIGKGAITGNFWNTVISGCHFEYTNCTYAPLYFAGDQALKGIRITDNAFYNSSKGDDRQPHSYNIYIAPNGPVVCTIENNKFHSAAVAAIYAGRDLSECRIATNYCDGQLIAGPFVHTART